MMKSLDKHGFNLQYRAKEASAPLQERQQPDRKWERIIKNSKGMDGDDMSDAVFIPLGYLVEHERHEYIARARVTNYGVLLNITTQPVSLWLA